MSHTPELLHVIEQDERDKTLKCVRLEDSNGVFALVADEKYGDRIAALWNMAERLGLSTEDIEGIIAAIRTAEVDGERYCHSEYGSANCKWEPGIGCTPKCPECIP